MYVPKALLVLLLTPIALIVRPLFYVAMVIVEAIRGIGFKGFALLPLLLVISPLAVLYASLGLLLGGDLGNFSMRNICIELFTGMN